jgi:hypothetical protein
VSYAPDKVYTQVQTKEEKEEISEIDKMVAKARTARADRMGKLGSRGTVRGKRRSVAALREEDDESVYESGSASSLSTLYPRPSHDRAVQNNWTAKDTLKSTALWAGGVAVNVLGTVASTLGGWIINAAFGGTESRTATARDVADTESIRSGKMGLVNGESEVDHADGEGTSEAVNRSSSNHGANGSTAPRRRKPRYYEGFRRHDGRAGAESDAGKTTERPTKLIKSRRPKTATGSSICFRRRKSKEPATSERDTGDGIDDGTSSNNAVEEGECIVTYARQK